MTNGNLKDPENLHQVPSVEGDLLEGIQTQLQNLQGAILAIQAEDQGLDFLRQEMRDASELMRKGVMEFRELRDRIRKLEKKMKGISDGEG